MPSNNVQLVSSVQVKVNTDGIRKKALERMNVQARGGKVIAVCLRGTTAKKVESSTLWPSLATYSRKQNTGQLSAGLVRCIFSG